MSLSIDHSGCGRENPVGLIHLSALPLLLLVTDHDNSLADHSHTSWRTRCGAKAADVTI